MRCNDLVDILQAIHHAKGNPNDIDSAANLIRKEVQAVQMARRSTNDSRGECLGSAVLRAVRQPRSVCDALNALEIVRVLDEKDVKLMRRLEILTESLDGGLLLRNIVLSAKQAMVGLSVVVFFLGVYVAWILFGPGKGVMLVAQSYLAGYVISMATCHILDRSIRLWPVLEKLETSATWLKGVSARN